MKNLSAKIGSYTNRQGETKNRYVTIGKIMTSQDGSEYALIDPTINLGGVLMLQNQENVKQGRPERDSIMAGVYEQQNQQQNQQGYQQQPQQNQQQNSIPMNAQQASRPAPQQGYQDNNPLT